MSQENIEVVRRGYDFWFVHTPRDAKTIRLDMLTSKARAFEVMGLAE
jgi:hypothetical protein